MIISITPLQAVQNEKSDQRQYMPAKQRPGDDFAAILKRYAAEAGGVYRPDGFTRKERKAAPPRTLRQSDIGRLWQQICRVNNVISALIQ
jgi:hypothetical protein